MASVNFGAVPNDVLRLLPGTIANDFATNGETGTVEIQSELDRQERAIRSRMPSDLVAKVNAASGAIPALADVCAICAASRLGTRTEQTDGGTPPIHVQVLTTDCDEALKLIAAGKFTPPGLGTNDSAPPPGAGGIICTRA